MSPSTGSRGASRTGPTTRATSSTPKPQTRSGPGTLRGVPIKSFGRDLYLDGRIIPLDLSTELGIHGGPATSPALVAHFVRIRGGEQATEPRFRPTKFRRADAVARLDDIASRPGANDKSRVSVLLANAEEEQTLTITHVLWAMFGLLPPDQEQRPHRHQSVALDLILDAKPGCYTLLGTRLDERDEIVNPTRVDWEAGGAFVTPPGLWHAHFNESGAPAHLIPIQDAGLQTYLRSLDIRFSDRQ